MEYEEILKQKYRHHIVEDFLGSLSVLRNVSWVEVHFQLNLITADPDDNKFVDCAFAGNAHGIVTHDRHFDVLANVSFPHIPLLRITDLKQALGL